MIESFEKKYKEIKLKGLNSLIDEADRTIRCIKSELYDIEHNIISECDKKNIELDYGTIGEYKKYLENRLTDYENIFDEAIEESVRIQLTK